MLSNVKIGSVPSGTLNNFYPGTKADKQTNKQTNPQVRAD